MTIKDDLRLSRPDKEFMVTFLTQYIEKEPEEERRKRIVDAIKTRAFTWSSERLPIEQEWLHSWSEYFSNMAGARAIRNSVLRTNDGSINTDWRHNVPTGKAFEIVETMVAHIMSAIFPTEHWFDLRPKRLIEDPDWKSLLNVLKHFIENKLNESYFKSYFEIFLRQLSVVGTSVLALPWRYETETKYKYNKRGDNFFKTEHSQILHNGWDFEVVDMFDFFIDPFSTSVYETPNIIRRIVLRRGELLRLVEDGTYPLIDKESVYTAPVYIPAASQDSSSKQQLKTISNMYQGASPSDLVQLYEYWGTLSIGDLEFTDICATILDDHLASFMPNPYWGGIPFVIGTFIDVHDRPYGLSPLHPILGQLQKLFECQNHRLDVNELLINPALMVLNDGSVDLANFQFNAGSVIPVPDVDTSIRPVILEADTRISVQDEMLMIDQIERSTGIGNYVGVNSGRDAERVTAEEVRSKKDAGGIRLGSYQEHIERTILTPFLAKAYQFLRQYTLDDEIVSVKQQVKGSYDDAYMYFVVGFEELQHEIDVIPVGSEYVIRKENALREKLDFIHMAYQIPEMAQLLDWQELTKETARLFLGDDWERFLMSPDMMMPDANVPTEEAMPEEEQQQQLPYDLEVAGQEMANDPDMMMQMLQQNVQNTGGL